MATTTMSRELRELLDSDIPGQIATLEESSVGLERVAAYCEANYSQSSNKEQAFNDTKKLTLQSLASVAYYINSLSTAVLRSLELEAENLSQKGSEIHNLKQEKTPRYQRTAVDYSILDGIGHGRRVKNESVPLSSHLISRTGSIVSGDSIPSNHTAGSNNPYEQYAMFVKGDAVAGTHTLTRNSVRSVMDQYRVPQVIASAIPANLHEMPYQRYSSAVGPNYSNPHASMMMGEGNYGTLGRASVAVIPGQHQQMPGLMPVNSNAHYRLSTESTDGLPPPPIALSHPHYHQTPHPDDPLPPPPPMPSAANYNALQDENNQTDGSGWVPSAYIEKSRVVYAYEAARPDELTLMEDAIVYILRKNEDGWFEGVMDGITGLFPGNYVTAIPE